MGRSECFTASRWYGVVKCMVGERNGVVNAEILGFTSFEKKGNLELLVYFLGVR